MSDINPEDMTREEYQKMVANAHVQQALEAQQALDVNSLYPPNMRAEFKSNELGEFEDGMEVPPSFFAQSRKAFVSGFGAFAAAAGPLIYTATADGVFDWTGEGLPILVISLGAGVAAFFATYRVPNAV